MVYKGLLFIYEENSRLLFTLIFCRSAFTQLPPWTRFKLDNGLEVLVCENHLTPIVTIEVAVKNGSFTETPEINGLSHLYEHMFFTANKRDTSEDDFLDRVDRLGIVYNGETHEENVQYYFTLPKQNLEKGLDFMSVAISSPLFKESELQNQKIVVNGEFDRNEANPYFEFTRDISKNYGAISGIERNRSASAPRLNAATREKMLAIQKNIISRIIPPSLLPVTSIQKKYEISYPNIFQAGSADRIPSKPTLHPSFPLSRK